MRKRSGERRRHVVAWLNRAEWDQVLERLYSSDPGLQRLALGRVSAWKARYGSSTPVAVDCTADLVRCQALDRAGGPGGAGGAGPDRADLVLLYGAALVRFVNLITERQQGRVARPLRRLAGRMRIPEWVVDLRHDFTHRKLPSLAWGRRGCRAALDWLQQEYWSRQLGGAGWDQDQDQDQDQEEDQEEELGAQAREMGAYRRARGLLMSYQRAQFEALGGGPGGGPFAELDWVLAEVKQASAEASALLVDVLLEDGFLVPTAEQLQALGCDPPAAPPAEPKLPQAFLSFWLGLLRTLNSPAFIHLLLEKLFAELKLLSGEPPQQRVFYVCAWISELIACNSKRLRFETKLQRRARLKERIFVNRIQMRWQQLLAACLEAACASTPHLLRLILDDMEHPLPVDTRHKLLQLCSIYTQADPAHCGPSPQKVYTLESLHEQMQRWRPPLDRRDSQEAPEAPRAQAEALRGSPWQLCTDQVSWKTFPLGRVPRQSSEPSSLMVDGFSTLTVFDQLLEAESRVPRSLPEAPPTARPADLLWTNGDVVKLKCGLRLF